MDGRGGCCIARYAGGGGAYQEKKMTERGMLKFRPIAPKPATGAGSSFGASSSNNKTSSGQTIYVKAAGRGKRKFNIDKNNNKTRRCYGGGRKRIRTTQNDNNGTNKIESSRVTLSLLPESPTDHFKSDNNTTPNSRTGPSPPIRWLSFNSPETVESVVTVECVMDMWAGGGEGLGMRTDEERLSSLERDTCPGFITDNQMQVKWINKAYEKVASLDGHKVVVIVVMKDERVQEAISYPAFTCRVRVQQKGSKEIKILPCDVWRMYCGGFAWRLDVKSALSLGRC